MPRLFLHIGAPKTGTTSLQAFLGDHYDRLLTENVLYPRLGCDDTIMHHVFARPLCAATPFDGIWSIDSTDRLTTRDEITAALHDEMARTGADTVVISSEVFFCLSAGVFFRPHNGLDVAAACTEMFADFDTRVIAYVRRQDRWLESCYIEAIKGPHTLGTEPIEQYDLLVNKEKLDFARQLAPWEAAFGSHSMIVRSFDSAVAGDGVIDTFLTDIGLTRERLGGGGDLSGYFANKSPPPSAVELVRRLNIEQMSRGDRDPRLLPTLSEIDTAFASRRGERFLSTGQSQDLIQALRDQNEELADRYDLDDFRDLATAPADIGNRPVFEQLQEAALIRLILDIQTDRKKAHDERDELFDIAENRLSDLEELRKTAEQRLTDLTSLESVRDELYELSEQRLSDLEELKMTAEQRLADLEVLKETAEQRLSDLRELQAVRDELYETAEQRLADLNEVIGIADDRMAQIIELKAERNELETQLNRWKNRPVKTWFDSRKS